jgi:hypothetical protein
MRPPRGVATPKGARNAVFEKFKSSGVQEFKRATEAFVQLNLGFTFRAHESISHAERHPRLIARHFRKERLLAARIAVWTKLMLGFAALHLWLQHVSESMPERFQFVPLLLSIPCFKASHFFFKLAYALGQLRLHRLCGELFFLQFYDRRVATGSVVNVLQSLRYIERGLEGADSAINLRYHKLRS